MGIASKAGEGQCTTEKKRWERQRMRGTVALVFADTHITMHMYVYDSGIDRFTYCFQ